LIYARRKGKVVVFHKKIYVVSIDRDGTCEVHVSPDIIEAKVDFLPPKGDGKNLTLSMVLDKLERLKVVKGVNRETIEECIEIVNEGTVLQDVLVARGKPALKGKDSSVQFHVSTKSEDIGFRILPDGRIDYKKQAPIKMVEKGEHLATITEAGKGEDGYRINGERLPAEDGDEEVVIEGENVRKGEDGKTFYAECGGIVSFHNNILNVYPPYQVEGDVDMKSGNILFNGSVTILGTVRSGFEVKATGDVFVTGSVEAATVEAGRDIRINGAIVGGEGSYIKAIKLVLSGDKKTIVHKSLNFVDF
jgi:uncharacterized protein